MLYDENEKIEIIDGKIYNMTPAPSRIHQKIIMELSAEIRNYIKANNGSCEVYPAPFDVILKMMMKILKIVKILFNLIFQSFVMSFKLILNY